MLSLLISLCFSQIYYENLDEQLRFQEDPHYADYIEEKVAQKELRKKARQAQRLERQKKDAEDEALRRAYVAKRDADRLSNEAEQAAGYEQQLKDDEKAEREKEANRKAFVQERNTRLGIEAEQKKIEIGRMREEVKKLPPSFFEQSQRPKVVRKKRKFN